MFKVLLILKNVRIIPVFIHLFAQLHFIVYKILSNEVIANGDFENFLRLCECSEYSNNNPALLRALFKFLDMVRNMDQLTFDPCVTWFRKALWLLLLKR